MTPRPSLLVLLAGAAGLSLIANGVQAAGGQPATPPTRMGVSIEQDLTARDQAAARRNRALDMREQAAKAAEQRLRTSLEAQQQAPAPRAAPAAQAPQEDRFTELARIYQAMRPKSAAVVFEQLAMDVQVEVAERMRERSTALILANMTPRGAAALTMAMARRNGPATAP